MSKMLRMLSLVAGASIFTQSIAFAQTAPAAQPDTASTSGDLQIVVTAERRSESVQKVSLTLCDQMPWDELLAQSTPTTLRPKCITG
jgi:hypothetical protein